MAAERDGASDQSLSPKCRTPRRRTRIAGSNYLAYDLSRNTTGPVCSSRSSDRVLPRDSSGVVAELPRGAVDLPLPLISGKYLIRLGLENL